MVLAFRRNFERKPCLSDFASFVHEENILVNDPIFSKDAVKEYVYTPEREHDKKKEIQKFCRKRGRSGKTLSV